MRERGAGAERDDEVDVVEGTEEARRDLARFPPSLGKSYPQTSELNRRSLSWTMASMSQCESAVTLRDCSGAFIILRRQASVDS